MVTATGTARWAVAQQDMTTTTMETGDDEDNNDDAEYTTMAAAQGIRQQRGVAWRAAREARRRVATKKHGVNLSKIISYLVDARFL